MQDAAVNNVVDFCHSTDIARVHFINFQTFFALEHDRTGNLKGLLAVINIQGRILGDAALVQTEKTDLADIGVVDHFEYVSQNRAVCIRECHVFGTVSFVEKRRIGFSRVRQVADKNFDQVTHADQVFSRRVANRNDVT